VEPPEEDALDNLIETALRTEPARPVPKSLYSKIKGRLTVLTLIHQERKWLQYSIAAGGAIIFAIAGTAFLLVVFRQFLDLIFGGIPGFQGYIDYLINSTKIAWHQIVVILAMLLFICAVPIGGVFLLSFWLKTPRNP
jgi:hypothetical protein